MLSANTMLKLYAPGSNGTLNFMSNVTLSSGTEMDLAANTITIQPSVLVTIAGTGGAANIYTNNANYSGFGGTNPSNGTFGGAGANNPQPLATRRHSVPPCLSSSRPAVTFPLRRRFLHSPRRAGLRCQAAISPAGRGLLRPRAAKTSPT